MIRGDNYSNTHKTLVIMIFLTFFSIIFLINEPYLTGKTIFDQTPDSISGKDTYIRENLNANFGTATTMRIGKVASGINHRMFLSFNLSSISPSETIINASINLNLTYASNSENIKISVYRVLYPWEEEETTWYNRTATNLWETVGGTYGEKITEFYANEIGTYSFEITEMVNFWIQGIYPNNGIIFIAENASAGSYKEFASSDYAVELQRPNIKVHHSSNAQPIINEIITNFNFTDRILIGESASFEVDWTDLENDETKMFVCDSQNIQLSGCENKTYCSTEYSSENPHLCFYTIQTSDRNNDPIWIGVCDEFNCEIQNVTLNMNHPPSINLILPNGGETINQENGDYIIRFETYDLDVDNTTLNFYYGETQNSTEHEIISNLNSSAYCIDTDFNPITPQQCTYYWNTEGIYGNFFLTIMANDSLQTKFDSSNNVFYVRSLIDLTAPKIDNVEISKDNPTSGEEIIFYANITEPNLKYLWVSINTTPETIKYFNISNQPYSLIFESPSVGTYTYQIFAEDIVGNENSSEIYTFNVHEPEINYSFTDYPEKILPNHVARISINITAINPLKDVQASLNIPDNFIFLQESPKTIEIGNFSQGETKPATWHLSAPLTEGTYNFSVTIIDKYSNSIQTENFSLEVSQSESHYYITVTGYPEVETNNYYYAQAVFTENGIPLDADSLTLSLYDPARQLTVGPVSMQKISTGVYNFSYLIGSSPTEGQWETFINATKDFVSYYTNTFWKLTGGPFDVRNIQILNPKNNNLEISITTENTGGANKDLILNWNLTRMDNGQMLDSATETFMVEGNSEKIWTIHPQTDYIGQAKITFIGYYGFDFTEKAGAYKIFSIESPTEEEPETPSGGGGGGGGSTAPETSKETNEELELLFENKITLIEGDSKTSYLQITNNGEKNITNIKILSGDLQNTKIKFDITNISTLQPKESKQIEIILTPQKGFSKHDFYIVIDSDQIYTRGKITLSLISSNQQAIENLFSQIASLKSVITDVVIYAELTSCENILLSANETKEPSDRKRAEKCVETVKTKIYKSTGESTEELNITFLIIIGIIVIIIIFLIYLIFKQVHISKLMNKPSPKKEDFEENIEDQFQKRIKEIEKNLR